MIFRIALVGLSDPIQHWLTDILQGNDFSVEICDPSQVSTMIGNRMNAYDAVIISAHLAAEFAEDTMFSSLLDVQGFLIFDEQRKKRDVEPSFLIHRGMSPEDILARINNILFLHSTIRKSPRIRISLDVAYEYEGKHYQSTMQDLSENGAFIITLAPPPRDMKITARFLLPGAVHEIVATGRAIYTIGYNLDQSIIAHPSSRDKKIIALPGFAFTFDEMTDGDRAYIREFLIKRR